jgi:hypothetical protein
LITATGTGVKTSNIQDSSGTITIVTGYGSVSGAVGIYGNVTAGTSGTGFFIGNGSYLSGLTAGNIVGQVGNALVASTVYTNAQPNITSVGTLTTLTSGTHTLSANANVIMSGSLSQLSGANLVSANYVTTTANGNILMSGTLSQISGANLISGTYLTGTLTTAAQPNITSTGTLASLTVTGNISSGNANLGNLITANYTTAVLTTAAQPNITSVGSLSSLIVSGQTSIQQSVEVLNTKTSATGTVDHDFSTGAVFYHSSVAANFTANFTNVPTTDNRVIVISLIIVQGGTPYLPTAVQIAGVAQTIKWSGGAAPTGTASVVNTVTFALFRVSSAWSVTGVMGSFS